MLMIVCKKRRKKSVISKISCEGLFNYYHNTYDANKNNSCKIFKQNFYNMQSYKVCRERKKVLVTI